MRRAVSSRERGRVADGHAVLVLRIGNDGHGPAASQSGVGVQRHRTSRRGLSGCRAGRSHAKRHSRVWHLWSRRSRGRRRRDACRRARQDSGLCSLRSGGGVDAWQGLFVDGRNFDGHRRFDGRFRVLGKMAGHACRRHRHERVHRPDEQGPVRSGGIREGTCLGERELPRRRRLQQRRNQAHLANNSTANGRTA